MDLSMFRGMLQEDAVSAGYGVVTSNMRKAVSKVLEGRGVGQLGINALSIVAGMGLSQVNNPHVKIIGSALRITGIASMGNSIIEKILNRNSEEK